MIRFTIFLFTLFFLISCSSRIEWGSQKEVTHPKGLLSNNEVTSTKVVTSAKEVSSNKKEVDQYYNYNVDRNGDEYLSFETWGYTNADSNIILVWINTNFKNFERLVQSKSWKILSKNEHWWYRVELSEELIEFMVPPCRTYSSDERQSDYFTVYGDYSRLYPKVLYPTEPCETYYKRRNEEKQSSGNSWSLSSSDFIQWSEGQTWLPLAVSLKSTEIYNGSKVAERQILLISKDDVSFNDMKRVIEDKGWKLLAKNFNLYQVDVSSQGESLDEILKMAESIPEVEVASVNSVSSPN